MNPGDYALLDAMMMHAVGRYGCGAAVLLGPSPDPLVLTFDVCLMGQHLPQHYNRKEVHPLDGVDLASHGLCVTCKGWGLTSLYDHGTVDDVVDGKAGEVCPDCGGSGRKGITITVTRTDGGAAYGGDTRGQIEMAPDAAEGVTCELCAKAYVAQQ